ncbi:MAG: winged helix-turn-helix domain-containing protein [Pseudomonadota bacterium]
MTEEQEVLRSGAIRLDIASARLERDGEAVELRHKHLQLLHALMQRPGELVSKRELIELGWGHAPVTDAVLTTAIKEIRRALADDARSPWAVENVHGRGYRFLAAVSRESAPPAPLASGAPIASGAPSCEPSKAPTRTGWIAAAAVVGLIALGLALVLAPRQPPTSDTSPRAVAEAPPSIAVLPLDDMSPQSDQGWFADGLAEEILNELARSPRLRVASRTSAFRFRDAREDVRDIAEALDVDYVVEGSVRTAGERLRITVQLIRASDGLHVLSESWNRPFAMDQVFDVQREISTQILDVLSLAIAGDTPTRQYLAPGEVDLQAYEQFLRGRELVRSRTQEGLAEGMALLEQSLATSPDYAPSHATLAMGQLLSGQFTGAPQTEGRAQAAAHIRTAMALAPESAEVLTAAALLAMIDGEIERSLSLADQALVRAPSTAEAQFRKATALNLLGQVRESYLAFQRASLLDPLSPTITAALAAAHLHNREEARALELTEHVYRWRPDHPIVASSLAIVLMETGRYVRAFELIDAAWRQGPDVALINLRRNELLWRLHADSRLEREDSAHLWSVGAALALERGDKAEALALARANLHPTHLGISAFDIAYWAGDRPLARSLAERTVEQLGLTEARMAAGYDTSVHQAAIVLSPSAKAEALRALMNARYVDWSPPENGLVRDEELVGAAAWRLLNDDTPGAIAWLEYAADHGRVLRELRVDPLFASLQSDERFKGVVKRMEWTATRLREQLSVFLAEVTDQDETPEPILPRRK